MLSKLKVGKHREIKIKIPTLKQAWDSYMILKNNQLAPNTIMSYKLFVNKWILSDIKLSKTPITHITASDLQKIVNKMLNEGMSPRTSKGIKEALRPMFKLYVLDGTLKSNPATLIQIPKFDNQINVELDNEKIHELYDTLYSYPIEPFRSILDKNTIRLHWEKILVRVGIKIRMHDLRHLIGGVLVSEGKTLEQIASILGHTSTNATKRYSKVRQEVAAEFGGFL